MELTWAKTLHCNKEIATVIENSMTSLYEWFLKSIVEAARPPEVLMLSGKQPFIFMRFSYTYVRKERAPANVHRNTKVLKVGKKFLYNNKKIARAGFDF